MTKDTRKIVINKCYGGFGLSKEAVARLKELGLEDYSEYETPRDDPRLVQVVEELGREANGEFAELCIVEIPSNAGWEIEDYDGIEWVAETHRKWG